MKSVPLNPGDPPEGPHAQPEVTQSFDEIYERHFPFVWRCLRGMGVGPTALDDAAQDVFLVVHRQLGGFRGESSAQTWLYGIARHVASNHQRRAAAQTGAARAPGLGARAPRSRAARTGRRRGGRGVRGGFLAGLDHKKRDLFILAVLEEMTIPEVAAALAIPLNTAYTRLRSVRADFERALGSRKS